MKKEEIKAGTGLGKGVEIDNGPFRFSPKGKKKHELASEKRQYLDNLLDDMVDPNSLSLNWEKRRFELAEKIFLAEKDNSTFFNDTDELKKQQRDMNMKNAVAQATRFCNYLIQQEEIQSFMDSTFHYFDVGPQFSKKHNPKISDEQYNDSLAEKIHEVFYKPFATGSSEEDESKD